MYTTHLQTNKKTDGFMLTQDFLRFPVASPLTPLTFPKRNHFQGTRPAAEFLEYRNFVSVWEADKDDFII